VNKRELEKLQFERLGRSRPDLQLTLIEQPDPPAPDIVADTADGRVGIEIIAYFSSKKGKQREAEEDAIVSLAKSNYIARGGLPVRVTVAWNITPWQSRLKRRAFADLIAKTVLKSIPSAHRSVVLEWDDLSTDLCEVITQVRISRRGDDCWHAERAGWVPKTDVSEIQEIITRKEPNLAGYRPYCEKIWLLITSDSGSPSSWSEISDE
jgi:hypothetical protein